MMVRDIENLQSMAIALATQPNKPLATSRGRNLPGVTVDVHDPILGIDYEAPGRDHHILVYIQKGAGRLMQTRSGKRHDTLLTAGTIMFLPECSDSRWVGDQPAMIKIRIPPNLICNVAQEVGKSGVARIDLKPVILGRDAAIESISCALAEELRMPSHPAQPLVMSSLSCALSSVLFKRYEVSAGSLAQRPSGLSRQMLARVISYMEDHVESPVRIDELAALAGISRFHFSATFKKSTGVAPSIFLERIRIKRAICLLKIGKLRPADVAFEVGFADQSHFTRRFRLHTGQTPAEFSREARMADQVGGQ